MWWCREWAVGGAGGVIALCIHCRVMSCRCVGERRGGCDEVWTLRAGAPPLLVERGLAGVPRVGRKEAAGTGSAGGFRGCRV